MTTGTQGWLVQPGTDVYGSDGTRVGEVDAIAGDFLVIRKGFFFPQDHHIPLTAIAGHTDDRIDLNVTGDQARNEEWGSGLSRPVTTTTSGYAAETVPGTTVSTGGFATDPADASGTGTGASGSTDRAPFEHRNLGLEHRHDAADIAVPVVQEELTASRQAVERGAVRVETVASEREQTLQVPVTEERVHVERHAVDRPAEAGDYTTQSGTIEVPVYGEDIDTQKRARVVEEVEISKDAVQETRTVSDTVRREDIEVVDGTVDVTDAIRAPHRG